MLEQVTDISEEVVCISFVEFVYLGCTTLLKQEILLILLLLRNGVVVLFVLFWPELAVACHSTGTFNGFIGINSL